MPNEECTRIVVDRQGYRDLDDVVILAGGDLGIYFVNGENVCGETDFIKEYANDPIGMVRHAIGIARDNQDYSFIIKTMAELADALIGQYEGPKAISGGQRRDWIFSGPIAQHLGWHHLALYKDGRLRYIDPQGRDLNRQPEGITAVHAADMLTVGSSAIDTSKTPPTGWIPTLRRAGVTVEHYLTLLTRNQGGEENLASVNVKTHALVSIDDRFLQQHSRQPEEAVAYFRNPEQWTRNYLAERPLEPLVKFFDPKHGKPGHARNFMAKYGKHLDGVGRLDELDGLVQQAHGKTIYELTGGN